MTSYFLKSYILNKYLIVNIINIIIPINLEIEPVLSLNNFPNSNPKEVKVALTIENISPPKRRFWLSNDNAIPTVKLSIDTAIAKKNISR